MLGGVGVCVAVVDGVDVGVDEKVGVTVLVEGGGYHYRRGHFPGNRLNHLWDGRPPVAVQHRGGGKIRTERGAGAEPRHRDVAS